MRKDKKIKVCIYVDRKTNEKFKNRFPNMLSRYAEKAMKDALKNKQLVLDSVMNDETNIFSFGVNQ